VEEASGKMADGCPAVRLGSDKATCTLMQHSPVLMVEGGTTYHILMGSSFDIIESL
jgi:hypothetical protein